MPLGVEVRVPKQDKIERQKKEVGWLTSWHLFRGYVRTLGANTFRKRLAEDKREDKKKKQQ